MANEMKRYTINAHTPGGLVSALDVTKLPRTAREMLEEEEFQRAAVYLSQLTSLSITIEVQIAYQAILAQTGKAA